MIQVTFSGNFNDLQNVNLILLKHAQNMYKILYTYYNEPTLNSLRYVNKQTLKSVNTIFEGVGVTYSDVSRGTTLGGLGSGGGRRVGELHWLAVPIICPSEVLVGVALQHQTEVQGGGQQCLQGMRVVVSRP